MINTFQNTKIYKLIAIIWLTITLLITTYFIVIIIWTWVIIVKDIVFGFIHTWNLGEDHYNITSNKIDLAFVPNKYGI